MNRGILRLASLVVALAPGQVGFAAQSEIEPSALRQLEALVREKMSRTPSERKIGSALLAAARLQRGEPVAQGVPTLPGVVNRVRPDRAGRVEVDIKGEVSKDLLAAIETVGGTVVSSYPAYRTVRAWVPLQELTAVADLAAVVHIGLAEGFVTNTGPNTSQGDAAHRAPAVRGMGITGAGIKVGVLSDGVNSLATRQTAGDLPAVVTVLAAGSGDEGTAMLEIVYDLAPGAQLFYATGVGGQAAMATNIQSLAAAGCKVIVDDLTYFAEGVFQDGPIAQAVNTAAASGVLYFSSAANSGNKDDGTSGTWEGDFVNSGQSLIVGPDNYGVIHSFQGSLNNQLVTVNSGPISLKWSDPLGASGNDYDLYILNPAGTTVVDGSADLQDGNDDPFEIVDTQPVGNRVVVVLYSGVARALHIDTNRGRLAINTEGNTFGHNATSGAITVAATPAGAGTPFTAANQVETYSSDGPRRMFYNANGTAITPGNVLFSTGGGTTLQKPDITAADCVTTGTAGFTNFCGTSAAAPHAGAIAALALSMASAPSSATVKAVMTGTALDNEAAGIDRDSGAGIVMADRIVAALTPPAVGATRFNTLSPCRAVDTRNANGLLGGPALSGLGQRQFLIAGACGVPTTAKAVSINVTITGPTAPGDLRIVPLGVSLPLVSTINFYPGQTRANNAVVQVGGGGFAGINIQNDSAGPVNFILDVNGYFQ